MPHASHEPLDISTEGARARRDEPAQAKVLRAPGTESEPVITPEIPANEALRLASLRDMAILDTEPEGEFDQITKLAAQMFEVPIALISLVDEDRQWFKSCIGLSANETGRDVSFCGHAINVATPTMVPDATKDERFVDNPLVTGEPYIRSYAGVPIYNPAGFPIGTLCLIDTKTRSYTARDQERLTALGQWVELQLQKRDIDSAESQVHAAMRHRFWTLSQDLLCVAGVDGFLQDVSPSFTITLGYTSEELTSKPFLDFVHPEDVASTMAEFEMIRDGRASIQFRNRYIHKDGHAIWLEWLAVPHQESLFAVARDVTDVVAMEDRLERVMQRLQQRSAELRDFTRIVAHDLRAPIRRIRQSGEAMPPASDVELASLDKMIQDLVSYEHILLAETPERDVNLKEIWEEAIDAVARELPPESVTFEGRPGPLKGDADQWSIVFRNLLDNSIKYQDPARPLQIRLQALPGIDEVHLHYTDNGQGIAPALAKSIWNPFHKSRSDAESTPHGLGLAMVRRIVERHGGTIAVAPAAEGAHFVIRLPPPPAATTLAQGIREATT